MNDIYRNAAVSSWHYENAAVLRRGIPYRNLPHDTTDT